MANDSNNQEAKMEAGTATVKLHTEFEADDLMGQLLEAKTAFWKSLNFAVMAGSLLGIAAGIEALIRW